MKSAIPTIADYHETIRSSLFIQMEVFSNNFLDGNREHLSGYTRKWVADPLHQWSRQWEYPYVYEKILAAQTGSGPGKFKIMDAGSGVTFFPYYLAETIANFEIHCVDFNKSYGDIFTAINKNMPQSVQFSERSLDNTGFAHEYFDVIYCISVLEHTKDFKQIINEFHKVLKPGGKLILTFDISLDGRNDISPKGASNLIESLAGKFTQEEEVEPITDDSLYMNGILTTKYAYNLDPELIWTTPPPAYKLFLENVKFLFRGKKWSSFPPMFTVYCTSFQKS